MKAPLTIAAGLWGLGGVVFLVAEAIAARAFPGYSYSQNYISLLGEPPHSRLAGIMNLGFMGEGLLYLMAIGLSILGLPQGRARRAFVTLGLLHAVGIILVAIFHSGQSDPLHPIGAFMAIAGGNLASAYFPVASRGLRLPRPIMITSGTLGFVGLACLLMLGVNIEMGQIVFPDGTWERGSVYAITAWELFIAGSLVHYSALVSADQPLRT